MGCNNSKAAKTKVKALAKAAVVPTPVVVIKKEDAVCPPVAARRPHDVVAPYGTRSDPYYWLRDDTRKDTDVLAYLHAENDHTNSVLAPVKGLEETIFAELRARVQEDDASVPTFDEGYWYNYRHETGKQYPVHVRRKGTKDGPEEILLDGNALALGHSFFKIGHYEVSRDSKWIAWTEDTAGRNQFTLRVKCLETWTIMADTASNVSGGALVWANDNMTLFYTVKDPLTLRNDSVMRHAIGAAEHVLVYREADESYYVSVHDVKSHEYIAIRMSSTTNSEVRLVDANTPDAHPNPFLARSKDHLYGIDHLNGRFVVRTNFEAKNFRIVEIVKGGKAKDHTSWKDIIPHRADTLVEASWGLYDTFLAASVRIGGLRKVQVHPFETGKEKFLIDAPDPAYSMTVDDTPTAASTCVRYTYDSLTQPTSVYELDLATGARTLLKLQPCPTYDSTQYSSEYIHATAKDGTEIPISLFYRKGTKLDGTAPLLVYGYGAYGHSTDPNFNRNRVSLVNRGWVYALAGVRGGQEMGRSWYEDGRLMNKMNTFTDFIATTEHLTSKLYGAPDKVFAMGGSAGGLLVGAIVNMRPELYRGVVSFVPFVDVVTTMLDETIPLTTNEYDEWGNPTADRAAYDYMLSYSPYDNIGAHGYPSTFVSTGLWDSQVQYFEPAKWIAKLRATKLDKNDVLLDTNMSAGHGGASGRFDALKEIARAYAFLLFTIGRPDQRKAN